ncbi:hypothetical protein GCM10010228_59030 [Streptomyces massasporeus]|nr:hypothetical protein GCM10010228_59030 [Streptomyces massasporeus]
MLVEPIDEVFLGPEAEGLVGGVHGEGYAVAGEDGLQVLERAARQPHPRAQADLLQEVVHAGALLPVLDGIVGAVFSRHGGRLRRCQMR